MMRTVRLVILGLLAGGLSACGKTALSEPTYHKQGGWSSTCLGSVAFDLPDKVLMAESEAVLDSGYGFTGIAGSETTSPSINRIDIQETIPVTLEDLKALQDDASLTNSMGSITRHNLAKLDTNLAFASDRQGFKIGYFDPTDKRIRLFAGGSGTGKRTTVEDAKAKYQELRHLYTARKPTDLPTQLGICTPYGFFKEPASGPVANYNIDIAVRSLKYPSLIIFVHIRPPAPNAPKSLNELRDPNNIKVDDLKSIKGIGAIGAIAALGNIQKLHEAQKITIAGQPGRLSAREYHHKGTLDTAGSGTGAAYEIQADAVGVQGQPDKPAITIKLAAALPDPFPHPPPVRRMSFGEEKIDYYKPSRPALKGVKTPPFDEAMTYFKQVLASVRPLPQLHGQASGDLPIAPTSAASR